MKSQIDATRRTYGTNAFLSDKARRTITPDAVTMAFDRACVAIADAILKQTGDPVHAVDVASTLGYLFRMRPSEWQPAQLAKRLNSQQLQDAGYAVDAIRQEAKTVGFVGLTESMAANIGILKFAFGSHAVSRLDELEVEKLHITEEGTERLIAATTAFGPDCPPRAVLAAQAAALELGNLSL